MSVQFWGNFCMSNRFYSAFLPGFYLLFTLHAPIRELEIWSGILETRLRQKWSVVLIKCRADLDNRE